MQPSVSIRSFICTYRQYCLVVPLLYHVASKFSRTTKKKCFAIPIFWLFHPQVHRFSLCSTLYRYQKVDKPTPFSWYLPPKKTYLWWKDGESTRKAVVTWRIPKSSPPAACPSPVDWCSPTAPSCSGPWSRRHASSGGGGSDENVRWLSGGEHLNVQGYLDIWYFVHSIISNICGFVMTGVVEPSNWWDLKQQKHDFKATRK